MPIDYTAAIQPSEITPREVWLRRRELLAGAAALGLAGTVANRAEADAADRGRQPLLDRRDSRPRWPISPATTISTSSAPTRAIRPPTRTR